MNQVLTHQQALQLIKERHGSQAEIAKHFGTTQQAVSGWYSSGQLPRKHWQRIDSKPAITVGNGTSEIDVSQLSIKEAKRIYEELKSIFN